MQSVLQKIIYTSLSSDVIALKFYRESSVGEAGMLACRRGISPAYPPGELGVVSTSTEGRHRSES